MKPAARRTRLATLAAATLLLVSCQSYSPRGFLPGTTIAQVQSGMGPPTATYPLPNGGVRLEYARGPWAKHTFMVDFDANSKLTGSEQVLTEPSFARIHPGMTRDEVLFAIGHPSDVMHVGFRERQHTVWSYRYDAIFCLWFQVSFNERWNVVEASYGPDPLCDRDDMRP